LEWAGNVVRMDDERMVEGWRKKETQKTKVKMTGLCGG
jgi:hypothetical protein